MCTLLTFNRDFWAENADKVRAQIKADAVMNDDGWALIAVGSSPGEISSVQSMRLETIIEVVEEGWWERCFLHSRKATSSKKGLPFCHGWAAEGWHVMHNGILHHDRAKNFDVDSQLLVSLIKQWGISAMVGYVMDHESFCNLLVVNPSAGKWMVYRSSGGTLFTDDYGNYSSHSFSTISKAVTAGTYVVYKVENFSLPKPKSYSYSGGRTGHWDDGVKKWVWDDEVPSHDSGRDLQLPLEDKKAGEKGSETKKESRETSRPWKERDPNKDARKVEDFVARRKNENEADYVQRKYGLPSVRNME